MKRLCSGLVFALLAAALTGCIIAPPPGPRPVTYYRPAPPPPPRPYYAPPPRPYYPPPPQPHYPPPPPPGVYVGVHIN
jgi:hypothetical protein